MNTFAHRGSNRLSVILTCLDMVATPELPAQEREEALRLALAASRCLADDLGVLLAAARRPPSQLRPTDVAGAIHVASRLHDFEADQVLTVTVDMPAAMQVDAEPMQLETALLRLLLLATRHGAAAVAIRARRVEFSARSDAQPGLRAGQYVGLEIEFIGASLPPGLLRARDEPDHVLERLREPDGLELAAVEAFVQSLRGKLVTGRGPGEEARLSLYLPLAAST